MKTEQVKITKLKVNSENPRTITKDKFDKLINSILVFPRMLEIRPIVVDGDYTALGGNQRTEALKAIAKMEITTIADILTEMADFQRMSKAEQEDLIRYWDAWLLGDKKVSVIKADELTEDERKQFIIKDNSSFGSYDWDMLANSWDTDLLTDWGLDLPSDWDTTEEEAREASEDDFTEEDAANAATRVKAGEIWQLGEHRLMCGDSTKKEDVGRLMDGEKADITFTSPPYNMGRGSDTFRTLDNVAMSVKSAGKCYNTYTDDVSDDEYFELLEKSTRNALDNSCDVMLNIGILRGSKIGVCRLLNSFSENLNDIIVWNKSNSMPSGLPNNKGMLSHRCELIFCFNKSGRRSFSNPQWEVGTMINRIDTNNASSNEYSKIHGATFPIELPSKIVSNFSKNIVLDLFGGTGTTLIACEQLDRKCYMMEIDSYYCDVIIARWEKLTGKEAVKIYG